ncbi:hypothetical protein O9G_000289 [Rozella allomycis CSF55]|uniref:Uncharacterized protein n=1 Tax=Rozella allomycis (strain CSF55) TaxID=988480 RepID=A0A075ASV6_ROZAC|nr:hypothetical protein O9G_000289 [Rozella allomycis CSF55]|eukprot:EPZ31810.1 hypothetical protein O9G_000289 [Rozella allomycis CSF55]
MDPILPTLDQFTSPSILDEYLTEASYKPSKSALKLVSKLKRPPTAELSFLEKSNLANFKELEEIAFKLSMNPADCFPPRSKMKQHSSVNLEGFYESCRKNRYSLIDLDDMRSDCALIRVYLEYQSALEEILGLEYFMNVEYELSMKKGDRLKHSRIYRQHDSKFECTDVLIERYHPETKSFDVICLNGECLNVKCTKIMFPFFKESEYFKALKEAKDERRRYIRSRFLDELPKLAKGFKANPKNFKDKDLKYYYHKAMIVGSIIEPQPLKIIEPILCVKGKVQEASKLIKGKHVCLKAVTALNRAITEINEHGFRLNIGEMISFKELEDQIMKHSKFMNRFYTEILPSITTQFASESGLGSFAKPILKSHVSYELNSEVYVIANSLKEERIRVIIPIILNTEAEINEMKGNFISLLKHSLSIYEIDDFLY